MTRTPEYFISACYFPGAGEIEISYQLRINACRYDF